MGGRGGAGQGRDARSCRAHPPQREAEDTTSSHHTGHCALGCHPPGRHLYKVPLHPLSRQMTSAGGRQGRSFPLLASWLRERGFPLSVFKATNLENGLGLCPGVLGWHLSQEALGCPVAPLGEKHSQAGSHGIAAVQGHWPLSLSPAMLDPAGPVAQVGPAVGTGVGGI